MCSSLHNLTHTQRYTLRILKHKNICTLATLSTVAAAASASAFKRSVAPSVCKCVYRPVCTLEHACLFLFFRSVKECFRRKWCPRDQPGQTDASRYEPDGQNDKHGVCDFCADAPRETSRPNSSDDETSLKVQRTAYAGE